jgi:hypothetical protein
LAHDPSHAAALPRPRPVQSLGRDFPCWASRTLAENKKVIYIYSTVHFLNSPKEHYGPMAHSRMARPRAPDPALGLGWGSGHPPGPVKWHVQSCAFNSIGRSRDDPD